MTLTFKPKALRLASDTDKMVFIVKYTANTAFPFSTGTQGALRY